MTFYRGMTIIYFLGIVCLLVLPKYNNGLVVQPETVTKQQQAWNKLASNEIREATQRKQINKKAKNVIMFLGDGMGISTLTASRILKGQMKGNPGEEDYLVFERFPNVALLKTYNVDAQVPDSAATATAYLSGVKANSLTLGVDENVKFGNCTSYDPRYDTISALTHALKAGKEAGLISTTTITHGSPAAAYAHSPNRFWSNDAERDNDVPENLRSKCPDVAAQFVSNALDFRVAFAGGRQHFLNTSTEDVEYPDIKGRRLDGRNLIDEWISAQKKKGRNPRYVWNQQQFNNIKESDDEFVLGLFNPSYMNFEIDRKDDKAGEPSISEMVTKAIKILSRGPEGYFLFVEGGRIDQAHHKGIAKKALTDTIALDKAVQTAVEMTNEDDTLILVTADHSHTFMITGYPTRGNDILGFADNKAANYFKSEDKKTRYTVQNGPDLANDNLPYTTLLYANGPGAEKESQRKNISSVDINDKNYIQQALVPFSDETHGGEDVAVYARGPMAHLFHRCHEQNYVAHVMMYAACVGDYSGSACSFNSSNQIHSAVTGSSVFLFLAIQWLVNRLT